MTQGGRRRRRLIWGAIVLGLVAAVAVAALFVTARPEFCRTCHLMKTRYVSWERSDHHPHAECLDCHAEPGFWGEIRAHLDGARYVYVLFTGRPQVILRAEVPPSTCVQCHPLDEVDDAVFGIDVPHRAHSSAGIKCEWCHSGFHDNIEGGDLRSSLEVCRDCHSSSVLSGADQPAPAEVHEGWSVDGVR